MTAPDLVNDRSASLGACRPAAVALVCGLTACLAGSAHAQDSTALAPANGNDAIPAYGSGVQRLRYVVDMTPLNGSWGGRFYVAPILKAPAETDPLFRTQMCGSTAVSAAHEISTSFPPVTFARWTSPGAGVNPAANSVPNPADAVTVSNFSRRFGVGVTGVSAGATNIVTALVGQRSDEPSRVYIERVAALSSRSSASDLDTATLTLGGVDAAGYAAIRADDATAKSAVSLRRDNLLRVSSALRNGGVVASLTWPENGLPTSSDPNAVAFLAYNMSVSLTTPAALPASITGSVTRALSLDFAARYLVDALEKPDATSPTLFARRGNPTFIAATNAVQGAWPGGGNGGLAGLIASLARAGADAPTQAFNIFAVDASGTPAGQPIGVVVPSPLVGAGGFTMNAAGTAEFRHYRNQSLFRGPSGHVALGFDPPTGTLAAAAVLTDPPATPGGPFGPEALVACRLAPTPQWSVVARAGTPVLDGPSGVQIGTVTAGTPVTFSAPGMDHHGNIYFVAAWLPNAGPAGQALIKAVRTPASPSGFTLERLLHSGQTFTGMNSTRPWTITRLRLADSDSIDSGGFHAGAVLQPTMPGAAPTTPADPRTFGGCLVNAVISYNTGSGNDQTYEAALLLIPGAPAPICPADINGDGAVNTSDLVMFLGRFGQTVSPGAPGDLNGDGQVNTLDLTRLLAGFGCTG